MEARYMVPDIETMEKKIKPALISAGAACLGWYGLTDIIYGPSDYNDRYVRMRIGRNARIPSLSVTLTHKAMTWGAYSRADTMLIHKPFPDTVSADTYIAEAYSHTLTKDFAFSRDGVRYALGDLTIFAEDILVPSLRWSVEIEGPDDAAIAACADTILGLGAPVRYSVPALVQRRLGVHQSTKVIQLFKVK